MTENTREIETLEETLALLAPNDVMMPIARGGAKHPMFPHRDSRWTREMFRAFVVSRVSGGVSGAFDVCVLLKDLVVIDVDSVAVADALEAEFPILNDVPTEATRRGRHYWFRRSAVCDERGYYDGAAQVREKVDFKTRTATGTAGVIVVAPSTGKRWLRHLVEENLIEIPVDLLDAVAVPRGGRRDLLFSCGERDRVPVRTLAAMSYFEPFLADDIAMEAGIPVPCTRDEFVAMVDYYGTRDNIPRVLELADRLGHAPARLARMTHAMLRSALEARDADADMTAAHAEHDLVALDPTTLAEFRGYPASVPAEAYVFPDIERPDDTPRLKRPVELFFDKLHPAVRHLLQKHAGKLVLAGGAVLGILTAGEFGDYDLFLTVPTPGDAQAVLDDVAESLKSLGGFETRWTSKNATTFADDKASTTIVQVVHKIYASPADVVGSFDVSPCMACAWSCPVSREEKVAARREFLLAIERGAFQVRVDRWNAASIHRIMKYASRGFRPYVVGLRRKCIRDLTYDVTDGVLKMSDGRGGGEELLKLVGIFVAERWLEKNYRTPASYDKLDRLLRGRKSIYDDDPDGNPFVFGM